MFSFTFEVIDLNIRYFATTYTVIIDDANITRKNAAISSRKYWYCGISTTTGLK